MLELLGSMGVDVMLSDEMEVQVDTSNIKNLDARYELVKTMRASILVLGPLLAKFQKATVALREVVPLAVGQLICILMP